MVERNNTRIAVPIFISDHVCVCVGVGECVFVAFIDVWRDVTPRYRSNIVCHLSCLPADDNIHTQEEGRDCSGKRREEVGEGKKEIERGTFTCMDS